MTEADKRRLAEIDARLDGDPLLFSADFKLLHRLLDAATAERDAMMAALRETEPVMALVRRINDVVLRSNGVGKSECTVDIECADYEDAADLFDLIEELAAQKSPAPRSLSTATAPLDHQDDRRQS